MTRRTTLVAVLATVSVVVLALIFLWPVVELFSSGCLPSFMEGPEATSPPSVVCNLD
jgi:hypothetical protein